MTEELEKELRTLKMKAVEAGQHMLEDADIEADRIFIYLFQNGMSFSVNGFFVKNNNVICLHNDWFTDEQMDNFTDELYDILDQMVDLCEESNEECPSEIKLIYDLDSRELAEKILSEEPKEDIDDRIISWQKDWNKTNNKSEAKLEKLSYQGIEITIDDNVGESGIHIGPDFDVLTRFNVKKLIKEEFIPWLLNDEFADRDIEKVLDGLEIFDISYHFGKIIAKYSPTKKDDYFGQFEFSFQSCSEYTEDILEAVAMEVYVYKDKIIKVSGYDI